MLTAAVCNYEEMLIHLFVHLQYCQFYFLHPFQVMFKILHIISTDIFHLKQHLLKTSAAGCQISTCVFVYS